MRLKIENLYCSYRSESVLKDFNLNVGDGDNDGEIVCLFGKSGCGKSTLLKAVAGLLPIDSGFIRVNGSVVNSPKVFWPPEKRQVGMIFQDYALFPHLTVLDNVAFSLPKSAVAEARELLQLVGLEDKLGSYPHELSGGQQQRVAIARTLAAKPQVLLMDEPFSNIDHQIRFELMRDIRQILKQKKISTIFVTHNKTEAFAFADKIAVMADGAVAQFDRVENVYLNPVNGTVGKLLGELNQFSCEWLLVQRDNGAVLMDESMVVATGQELLVRPQYVQVEKSAGAAAVVEELIMTGDHTYVRCSLGGLSLIAVKTVDQRLVEGDEVVVMILPHNLCLI
ncbi:MAG: ABC transporter ATP-binding protein [Candidatus Pelagadaptatus aseana]|uniref:ABC transporter ATP-binding protein n=1 Tax=Candidatus Pelagadaptatus aseana TaxID=3120508 RepID=UPI0039B1992D